VVLQGKNRKQGKIGKKKNEKTETKKLKDENKQKTLAISHGIIDTIQDFFGILFPKMRPKHVHQNQGTWFRRRPTQLNV
jgi:hypothetical protein